MISRTVLTRCGWPLTWALGVVLSVASGELLVSSLEVRWLLFTFAQAVILFATLSLVRQQERARAEFERTVEPSLWRAAASAVHDVGTPLHVVCFCAEQLQSNPSAATTPIFMEQFTRSAERCKANFSELRDLVSSLKDDEPPVSFPRAWSHALRAARANAPDAKAWASLDALELPDEAVPIGSASLVRSLTILLSGYAKSPEIQFTSRAEQGRGQVILTGLSSPHPHAVGAVAGWLRPWGATVARRGTSQRGGVECALAWPKEGLG